MKPYSDPSPHLLFVSSFLFGAVVYRAGWCSSARLPNARDGTRPT